MKQNFIQIAQQKVLAMLALREVKESDLMMTRKELKSQYFQWTPDVKIDTNRKN